MMANMETFILQLHIVEKLGVTGCNPLSPYAITRQEGVDPARPESVEFLYDETFGGVTGAYGRATKKIKRSLKTMKLHILDYYKILIFYRMESL